MTSNQFFSGRINPDASQAFLEGDEHHHLARVARIRTGDQVWIFDSRGQRFLTEVEEIGKDRTRLRIIRAAESGEEDLRIVLGQACAKPKAMDLIVQKATELGVSTIVPLRTARSLPQGESGGGKKLDRWRRIALEAAKQSCRPAVPEIEPVLALAALAGRDVPGEKIFLSENGGVLLREILMDGLKRIPRPDWVTLLTGPEGGWAPDEEKTLAGLGFRPVSLGRTIVRAETAAVCGVGMIAHFWNG
ncbi:MAG: RsmE family RNA methyltransferase [Candidatus Aminicenantales bacterium]